MKELQTTVDHDDLVKKLAWEVARNVMEHNRWVYKAVFDAAPSTFPISIRNGIYNQIVSAIECKNDAEIIKWIDQSEAHRNEMRRLARLNKKAAQANGDPVKID